MNNANVASKWLSGMCLECYTAVLHDATLTTSCAHPGWEKTQRHSTKASAARCTIQGETGFHSLVKRGVAFRVGAHPLLIPLCLISLWKTQFLLPTGGNWSQHSLSKRSHLLTKQFFCRCGFNCFHQSSWQMMLSCIKLTNSGVLWRINNFIRIWRFLLSYPERCSHLVGNQQTHRTHYSCTEHSLFKHSEAATLANRIDFSPKRISGLSSVDGKQSITEIGCHCVETNCLWCRLFLYQD